jgi:opacity protein-like surface antigen
MSPARPHAAAASLRSAGLRRSTQRSLKRCLTTLLAATALLTFSSSAHAQASAATASRKADLQVGGYFVIVPKPDYTDHTFYGGGAYATYDFMRNFGVEASYRQANTSSDEKTYERTYEIGGRYVRHYGRLNPYVRASYGRGVFNFPENQGNFAYNLFSFGGGVDVRAMKHINVRGDYEYQHWMNFLQSGLSPQVISIGAAYHF